MKTTRFILSAILTGVAGASIVAWALAAPKSDADYVARGERSWAEVKILADDAMEGRRPGTPGHRRAAEIVAAQFRAAGLAAAGDDGYFQHVTLESRTIRESESSLALVSASGTDTLKFGDDAFFNLRGHFAKTVDAPLVFVGYGLRLPQYGHDDLAGIDLKGKVVVAFVAAPKSVPGTAGAHFGSSAERWKQYKAAGAIGMVFVPNPHSMDLPWERIAGARLEPQMALAGSDEDLFAGQQLWMGFNYAKLDRLLVGTNESAEALLAKLKEGAPLPRFDLKVRVRATISADLAPVTSENVVGVLTGSDRKLASEHVALSAHLDHLGIKTEGEGDRIFNGAMDNATGVVALIDVARALSRSRARLKRSVVFVAVTAEESGLLGSRAFVARAQRANMQIVADLNSDMYLPLYPLKQLVVFGLDESVLGNDVRAVGLELGLKVVPDPQPQRNRFIRSDQYSFIRMGIPSLALMNGFEDGTPEADIEHKWFEQRYHAVADDPAQPVDFSAIGKFTDVLHRLTVRVANGAKTPVWRESSIFAGLAPAAAPPD